MPFVPPFRLIAQRALTFAALLAAVCPTFAQAPSANDGFDPDVNGVVHVVVAQPDGKLLLGGQFTTVGGFPRTNLARINGDGTLDASFNPTANNPVRAIVVQPDGRIVIGGDFTTLQPGGTGAVTTRNRIARLNADGSVDPGFNPNLGAPLQPQVFALVLQPNGQIVAGGSFTTAQPTGLATPAARKYLARFNADGSLDPVFDPNPNGMVLALAYHVDNKIVVGGGFTSLWPAGDVVPSTRNRIARLNPNGTVDSEFNPNANNGVTTLAVQRDGKILLGGYFSTLQPVGDDLPANRVGFARLNPNGTLDSEFYPRAEGSVSAIAVQPDGAILIGGTFGAVWGRGSASVARNNIARFQPDGSLDAGFTPTLNAEVNAFAFQSDGKIVIGGHFTRAQPLGSTSGIVRNHVARLNADGSFDSNFELDAGGRVLVSVTQSDGRIVVGGTFTNVGGETHNYVARLNADGSVDSSYRPDFNGRVYAMAYDAASNKVLVGGAFTTIGGETRNRIARLNPSGTIDSEFYPHLDGQVGVIVLQSDGRILVGGSFSSVQPTGTTASTPRSNLLRLNSNGTLDTTFNPSPNSSIASLAVQSDGKIIIGGQFSNLQPGGAFTTTTAADGTVTTTATSNTITPRNFLARINTDGTVDTTFNPNPNGQVSALALQSDGKLIIAGVFTGMAPPGATALTVRNRIARVNTDGTIDTAYDPNANGNVLALALQSDGKLILGGAFTTLQPNGATDWILRKYAARLNSDGTVDTAFNLDIGELSGNRVDSLRLQPDGRLLIGGNFTSLQPAGSPARLTRRNFARLAANGSVDAGFDTNAGGSTGAVVNGLAVQPDGKIIAVGSFADLGGAKSTNIARFRAEGNADPEFSNSLSTDGPVHAVAVRPNGAPVASQLGGFAWLNAGGTLRTAFATGGARLSGEINAIAVQADGRLLLGGTFADLGNTTGGNLIRISATGVLDSSFNPAPNGVVTGIAVQPDGRIIIVGSFTLVGGVTRNRIARINTDGSVDVTYDPNATGRINALVMEADGRVIVGGAFTSFLPNFTETAVTRNYLARVNLDGTIDAAYNPSPNFNVNAVTLQGDGKAIIGGGFTTLQPNGGTTAFSRNGIARLNTDGTLDQNFDPNPNAQVNTLVALANGQILVGGAFTTMQRNATGTVLTRNNLARVNSDGAIDLAFNPNANGAVSSLAVQADGRILVAGSFTTLQPEGVAAAVNRNHLARLTSDGALDPDFNPDINGTVSTVVARPDGSVLVGGNFSSLQLNGSIFLGGSFSSIGGVAARNLASLNANGSVNPSFQPRPDGVVNALLVLADGRALVGGAFGNIAGATRNRLARFLADGSLDPAFTANPGADVTALAALPDGRTLVGLAGGSGAPARLIVRVNTNGTSDASFTGPASAAGATERVAGLAVQPDGRILVLTRVQITGNAAHVVSRLNADGSPDASFANATLNSASGPAAISLQADGRILVAGAFTAINSVAVSSSSIGRLARLNSNGTVDSSFNPAPNGPVTALALQPDGRLMIGGGFSQVGGVQRVGIARISATVTPAQTLGVAANRGSVMWNRSGAVGEVSSVVFEQTLDRVTWTVLGNGTRVAGTANWQLTGLNLPASGLFYLRARGLTPTSAGSSSGLYETVREFTFSSPLSGSSAPLATTVPQTGAAPVLDPLTGIVPRSSVALVPGEGSVEIFVTSAAPASANPRAARLANLSTRGRVTGDDPLILGFAIAGTEPRRVLVRAAGPALNGFGVSGVLARTRLEVFSSSGALLASNEGWGNAAEAAQVAAATGAFPLTAGSADSAAVLTLAPGSYTMQVGDPRGGSGVALAEIYDAGSGEGSQLVNVSSRGAAGTGADALISGFVIAGDTSQRLLLRGVGPGLTRFGATGVVADPSVSLFDSDGRELGSNDNWVSSLPLVSAAAAGAGAFALEPGSKDAAVLANLPSGVYTIQVKAPAAGAALLEIYVVGQ